MNAANTPVLVFCLEELSAKTLLESLWPRLFPSLNIEVKFIVFEGKSDLEKKLERRLRGWLRPNSLFVVLRDQDSGDCVEIKKTLVAKCVSAGRSDALVRIACAELESWYLGDLAATETALNVTGLSRKQNSSSYRAPDRLANAAQELDRLTAGRYQKVSGSREIGKHLSLETGQNRSQSYQVFIRGLRRLVEPLMDDAGAPS
jgi:hypothetical protein